jgi:2-oxo-4-hydroxy-4-carboxy-5-ureidoimidazoline decarboxylase
LTEGLARFNALPEEEAVLQLLTCLASPRWAGLVAAGRPFAGPLDLVGAGEAALATLTPTEWAAAVAAHPRIGEAGGHSPATSEREQSGVAQAPAETRAALDAENRAYESRFGHVFLIAASGRGAGEILDALRRRMSNDPATEVKIAADELRQITRLRLERLVS